MQSRVFQQAGVTGSFHDKAQVGACGVEVEAVSGAGVDALAGQGLAVGVLGDALLAAVQQEVAVAGIVEAARFRDWRMAAERSGELAECLAERLEKQDIAAFLQPL